MQRTSKLSSIKDLDDTQKTISKKNSIIISLFLIFIIGMIYGTIVILYDNAISETLSVMVKDFLSQRNNQKVFQTLVSSFFSSFSILALIYLMGFWAISHPFIFFIIFFRGMGIGLILSYLYSTYAMQGVLFSLAIIILPSLMSTISIILASKESIRLSNLFLSRIFPKIQGEINKKSFTMYNIKYVILVSFILFSSIIDCICTLLFSRFFNL